MEESLGAYSWLSGMFPTQPTVQNPPNTATYPPVDQNSLLMNTMTQTALQMYGWKLPDNYNPANHDQTQNTSVASLQNGLFVSQSGNIHNNYVLNNYYGGFPQNTAQPGAQSQNTAQLSIDNASFQGHPSSAISFPFGGTTARDEDVKQSENNNSFWAKVLLEAAKNQDDTKHLNDNGIFTPSPNHYGVGSPAHQGRRPLDLNAVQGPKTTVVQKSSRAEKTSPGEKSAKSAKMEKNSGQNGGKKSQNSSQNAATSCPCLNCRKSDFEVPNEQQHNWQSANYFDGVAYQQFPFYPSAALPQRHPTASNGHACYVPGCGKVYTKPSHLKAHLRWHVSTKTYACSISGCSKHFSSIDELQTHLKDQHKLSVMRTAQNFQGSEVGLTVTQEADSTQNGTIKSGIALPILEGLPCPHCDKKFPSKHHLASHSQQHFQPGGYGNILTDQSAAQVTQELNSNKSSISEKSSTNRKRKATGKN